ncbi:hypothetical protein SNS2_2895 [Streptomyces netropsis]|nr:hypothetical protein SNS2_2895 [Streptomyces netropsis]
MVPAYDETRRLGEATGFVVREIARSGAGCGEARQAAEELLLDEAEADAVLVEVLLAPDPEAEDVLVDEDESEPLLAVVDFAGLLLDDAPRLSFR